MKANERHLLYFSNEDIMVEIPFFQRPYVWNEKNWADLFESIVEEKERKMPFIGSFIYQETSKERHFLIIDGQQRITTLSLLIKSFVDLIGKDSDLGTKFRLLSIIFKIENDNQMCSIYKPRLIPSSCDAKSFYKVMDAKTRIEDLVNDNDSIALAYKYFYKRFLDIRDKDSKQLIDIGNKILTTNDFFLIITLGKDDDEQKIFDSVNNFGQRLTFADSIKNFLFQKLRSLDSSDSTHTRAMKIYKDNWDTPFYSDNKKEFWYQQKNLGKHDSTNLEEFLKDFATIKNIYGSSLKMTLFEAYKSYLNPLSLNELRDLTKEMKDYADSYYDMVDDFKNLNDCKLSDDVNTTLLILNELESTPFIPYVLVLYKEKPEDYKNALKNLQKFILIRLIYKESNKNYNKIAESLLKKETCQDAINYLNEYNVNNSVFNFSEYPKGLSHIISRNDYQANLILFLIEMIRRNRNGENKYSDALRFNKTVEHIIPQNWEKWKDVPCFDFDNNGEYKQETDEAKISEIRETKIYSIGNMILLSGSLNSTISNDLISIKIEGNGKKDGIRKFVNSLSVSKDVVDIYDKQGRWDERDINDRAEELFSELNEYYGFTNEYIKKNIPVLTTLDISETNNLEPKNIIEINDDFLDNEKVGTMVYKSISYLMAQNKLSNNDIENLKNKEFSSNMFGSFLPLLDDNPSPQNRPRYYRNPIEYKGVTYCVSSQIYNDKRNKIKEWIRQRLKD